MYSSTLFCVYTLQLKCVTDEMLLTSVLCPPTCVATSVSDTMMPEINGGALPYIRVALSLSEIQKKLASYMYQRATTYTTVYRGEPDPTRKEGVGSAKLQFARDWYWEQDRGRSLTSNHAFSSHDNHMTTHWRKQRVPKNGRLSS